MANRLLMLGGGHAQLALLEAAPELIAAGHHLTLVSPDPVHYYSGMAPGLLGGSYEPEEIRFPIREMAEAAGVTFVRDRAVRIDPTERRVMLAGGETIEYNVLSVNTGSSIAPTVAVLTGEDTEAPRVLTAKPIAMMVEARRFVELVAPSRALRLVVVGGGPAAVEIALNLRRLLMKISPEADARSSVELFAGRSVLPGFPPRAERAVKRALAERGVSFRSSEHVVSVTKEGVHTRLGAESADLV
ncbi:MAG: NAD(P)/FAD-dependent oxidoreductase, partial [Spirochaetota bacterium]